MVTISGPCYLMGDIHTQSFAVEEFARAHPGASLIVLGDCGLGGEYCRRQELARCADVCQTPVYCLRGNHDDPSFFQEGVDSGSSFLRFLPDYTELVINGKRGLAMGGAVSVDRAARDAAAGSWADEFMVFDESRLNALSGEIDILLSHTGPSCPLGMDYEFLQTIGDASLRQMLWEEARNCLQLQERLRPRRWYYGHFHRTDSWDLNGTECRILDKREVLSLD